MDFYKILDDFETVSKEMSNHNGQNIEFMLTKKFIDFFHHSFQSKKEFNESILKKNYRLKDEVNYYFLLDEFNELSNIETKILEIYKNIENDSVKLLNASYDLYALPKITEAQQYYLQRKYLIVRDLLKNISQDKILFEENKKDDLISKIKDSFETVVIKNLDYIIKYKYETTTEYEYELKKRADLIENYEISDYFDGVYLKLKRFASILLRI